MAKPKYVVDLAGQMAECEANYARIMKLLPNMAEVSSREFGVGLVDGNMVRLRITVKERCKYTTILEISQLHPAMQWSGEPQFHLRVYHDAQMAEVTAFQGHRHVRPCYDYPNDDMFHCDEKAQLNAFLGEWLSHCLQYGYALGQPVEDGFCELSDR